MKLKRPLAVFDLETTGVNVLKDRIIEIAILKAMPDGSVEEYHQFVNPGVRIPMESSAIHGITDEQVADEPKFKEVAPSIQKFLDGADLAGFNALKFDIPFLVEEFLRAEIDFSLEKRRFVDAQKIFHAMEKRTLTAAYKFYCDGNINEVGQGAHSALTDTQVTLEVLDAQLQKYDGQDLTDNLEKPQGKVENDVDSLHKLFNHNMVDLAGRMVFDENSEILFNFGKHKGKRVEDVLAQEPQYYNWIMKNEFPADTKNWLTKIKLNMASKKMKG